MQAIDKLVETFGPLAGRLMIALLFVPAGYNKIVGFGATVNYINSKALPMPEVAAVGTILVEVIAGLAIAVGFKTRYAALALAVFTLLAAVLFHNYWAVPEAQMRVQQIMFFKNVALVGGLLFIAAFGAGPFSLDNRRRD